MKKIFFSLALIAVISFVLNGCASGSATKKSVFPSALLNEWKHSYEESGGNVEIYRPADYKEFAPSHFRQVYHFKSNGECSYLVLHPADAHYMADGKWSYNSKTRIVQIRDGQNKIVTQFEVLDVAKDIMKIQLVR